MAKKLTLSTEDAVKEVQELIAELNSLHKRIAGISKGNIAAFNKMSESMGGFKSNVKDITKAVNDLAKAEKKRYEKDFQNAVIMERLAQKRKKQIENEAKAELDQKRRVFEFNQRMTSQREAENKAHIESVNKRIIKEKSAAKEREAQVKRESDFRQRMNAQRLREEKSLEAVLKKDISNENKAKKEAAAAEKAAAAIAKESTALAVLTTKTKVAKEKMQNLRIEQGRNSKAARKATKEYRKLRGELDKTGKVAKTSGQKFKGLLSSLGSLAGKLGFVGIIAGLVALTRNIGRTILKFDSLNFTIKVLNKTAFEFKQTNVFLLQLVSKFGVSLISTANRWNKFSAAAKQSGLTLKQTQDIFRSMTKAAAVLGLKTDELQGVYLALEQMLSKGKVTTEELRRQLGERLPGAMNIMAASMGVSISKLDEMLKKGEVMSAEVLPRFAEAVEIAFGIQSIEQVDNLQSAMGRLGGAWEVFIDKVINSEGRVSKFFSSFLNNATNVFNQITKGLATPEVALGLEVSERQDNQRIYEDDNSQLQAEKRLGIKLIDLKEKTSEALIAVNEATTLYLADKTNKDNEKALEVANQHHSDTVKSELDFTEETNRIRRERAKRSYKESKIKMETLQNELFEGGDLKKPKELFEEPNKQITTKSGVFGRPGQLIQQLAQITAAYNDAKLALEKPLVLFNIEKDDKPKDPPKLRDAKLQADLQNEAMAQSLEREIKNNEYIIAQFETTTDKKLELEKENYKKRGELQTIYLAQEKAALDNQLINDKKSLEEGNYTNESRAAALLRVNDNYREKEEKNQTKWLERADRDRELYAKRVKEIETEKFEFKKKLINKSFDEETIKAKDAFRASEKRVEDEKTLQEALKDIKIRNSDAITNLLIEQQQQLQKNFKEGTEVYNIIQAVITSLEADLSTSPGYGDEDLKEKRDAELSDYISASQSFLDEAFALGDAIYERKISNIEKEIAAETAKYDELIRLAKNDEEEIKILERNKEQRIEQLNKKKRKEQIKQAKLDKALQISQAISGTALAVIRALDFKAPASFIFAGLAAAAGAAQLATIIATPIPQFAQGGVMGYDGKALINDGGRQEYVERNGQVLTTGKTNAVVDLQKGDVIHKDFEELQRKTMLLSLTSGGESVTEKQLNLAYGIKEEIKDGFKKAKVNSNITVVSDKNNYRDKMSMW